MFIPCTNGKGAVAGLLGGLLVSGGLSAGFLVLHPPTEKILPLPRDCLGRVGSTTTLPPSTTLLSLVANTTTPVASTRPITTASTEPPITTPARPAITSLPRIIYEDVSTTLPPLPSLPSSTLPPSSLIPQPSSRPPSSLPSLLQVDASPPSNISSFLETLTELLTTNSTTPVSNASLPQALRQAASNETGWLERLREVGDLSPLLHPLLGFAAALLVMLIGSLAAGGNDIYAMDWNLVAWTCGGCTSRLSRQDEASTSFVKRRGRRTLSGVKSPYIHSESFRYARQAPAPYLEAGSNYRNPRVAQMDALANSTTSTTCGAASSEAQTRLSEDFFSTLRPAH